MATKHEEQGGQRVLYGFWLSPFMSLVAQMLKESGLDFRYERVSAVSVRPSPSGSRRAA